MAEQILPEGIRFFPKNDKAPDFVLGTMIITPNDLYEWLKANPHLLSEYQGKKQVKLQLLNSKAGKIYAAVDTWKPNDGGQAAPAATEPASDLPF